MNTRLLSARACPAVATAVLWFMVPCAGFADGDAPRFTTFGAIGVSTISGWNGKTGSAADATIGGALYLEMNDRFSTDQAELFLHHKISEPFQEPSQGYAPPPQQVPLPQVSLYEAYVRLLPASWVSLSIGRHRFNWGNGLILSPSDSFQPSAFQGATGEMPTTLQDSAAQTGFTGLGAQFFPSPDLTASVGVSVDDALSAGTLAPQRVRTGGIVSFVLGAFDCFLSGVYEPRKTLRPGAGASVEILGVILRGETALELTNGYDYPSESGGLVSFSRGVGAPPRAGVSAGIEKVFTSGDDTLSISGEYLYLGWGYSRDQERLVLASLPSSAFAVPQPMGQHYANLLVSFGRTDAWDLENLLMVDVTGPGIMGSHTVTFLGFQGVSLTAGLTWLAGGGDTEFGSSENKVFGTLQAQVDF